MQSPENNTRLLQNRTALLQAEEGMHNAENREDRKHVGTKTVWLTLPPSNTCPNGAGCSGAGGADRRVRPDRVLAVRPAPGRLQQQARARLGMQTFKLIDFSAILINFD